MMTSVEKGTTLPSIQDIQTRFSQFPNVIDKVSAISAYRICLSFEESAKTKRDWDSLIRARVLGYLIINTPTRAGLSEVAKEIHLCTQEYEYDKLSALGEAFVLLFIRPFEKFKESPPPSDREKIELKARINEAPQNYTEAKALALLRDGYKCVLSGRYDIDVAIANDISTQTVLEAGGGIYTRCVHILPDPTYFEDTNPEPERDYSASVLGVLKAFGYDIENLTGAKVHSLFNVMSLDPNFHEYFSRLEIWFEPTLTPHCYTIETYLPILIPATPITFNTSSDPESVLNLPLPSAELLVLHATCAKVAYMSGAGERLDELDREIDDTGVLASDGTSSEVLSYAFWNRAYPAG
ncbi:hypothetical protein BDN72DRAFT_959738 [Pluteus cervinus]|uniref:Uncharacterized protein n=1 Tax=Pluteus cervinus TaxID=181527 RepID=A0ACD3AV06_9AGAR|nr:hypothetical protein BDN72DRAFT_959738 [Pluteus cervinus]